MRKTGVYYGETPFYPPHKYQNEQCGMFCEIHVRFVVVLLAIDSRTCFLWLTRVNQLETNCNEKMKEEQAFKYWAGFVAFWRVFSIVNGFLNVAVFRDNMYARAPSEVTALFGRLFSCWTSVSVTLLVALVLYPRCKPIYVMNLVSFAVALFHYVTEYYVYNTATLIGLLLIFLFAGGTGTWMLIRWGLGWVKFDKMVPADSKQK
jgi:hypothetical protein